MMTPQEGAKLVTKLVTSILLVVLSNADVRAESSLGEDAIRCSIHAPAGVAATALTDPKTGFCNGFTTSRDGKLVADVRGDFLGSGVILISKDGERAVFVQSWFYGSFRGNGRFVSSGLHYDQIPLTNDGLVFFFQGKKTASYTIEELVHRPNMVKVGPRHVHWLDPSTDLFRAPLGKTLQLKTMSLRELSFDTKTGRQLSATDTKEWLRCTHIAYGEIHFDGRPAMDPVYTIKGTLPDTVIFKIPAGLSVRSGYQARCFKQGRTGWIAGPRLFDLNGISVAPNARNERRFHCTQDADCILHCDAGAVNRAWYEESRRSLGRCSETCDSEGREARCERRSCVARNSDGSLSDSCSRRR